jgi:hypothetical protein
LTTEKLVDVNEVVVIASENVAETVEFNATPEAAFAGETDETVGGVVSAAPLVVKLQVKLARKWLPAASVTPVVSMAVYCVLAARLANGVKVAPLLVVLIVPDTAVPERVATLKVADVTVVFRIVSEKATLIAEFTPTAIALFAGEVEDTVGGVVSAPGVVAVAACD